VKIDTSNLPTSVNAKDAQGNTVQVNLRDLATDAAGELTSWLNSNTYSGVSFSTQASSCSDPCAHVDWGGDGSAPGYENHGY
jgi:hypothetical protein